MDFTDLWSEPHLGVHGDYSFLLPELAGTLRDLRDPADDDDGADEED